MANKVSGAATARFQFDTSEVDRGLKRLLDTAEPTATERGLVAAADELLHDAIYVSPQAPKDVGDLRGSARVGKVEIAGGHAEIKAGFNIEYAARWHEWPEGKPVNWTTTKGAAHPGRKYLESKLFANRDKYMRIVGDFLRRTLTTG